MKAFYSMQRNWTHQKLDWSRVMGLQPQEPCDTTELPSVWDQDDVLLYLDCSMPPACSPSFCCKPEGRQALFSRSNSSLSSMTLLRHRRLHLESNPVFWAARGALRGIGAYHDLGIPGWLQHITVSSGVVVDLVKFQAKACHIEKLAHYTEEQGQGGDRW